MRGSGNYVYGIVHTYLDVFPHMRNRNIPLIGSIPIINRLDQTACQNNQTDPAKYTCPYNHAKKRINHQISLSSLEFSFSLSLSLFSTSNLLFLITNPFVILPAPPPLRPPPKIPRTKSHGGYVCTPLLPPPQKKLKKQKNEGRRKEREGERERETYNHPTKPSY